jgi:phosphoglycolate phosphatase/AHBA synthesis associated protein
MRAVLFDLDGVLVDSYQAWFHLINAAARDLGYPAISPERFQEIWGQGVDLDVEVFFTRHTVPEVEGYYTRHFREHASYIDTNPQSREVFAALRERGCGIAIITNTPSLIAREVITHAGLEPDILVGGTDVPHGKPAPDMVFRALESLGVSTEEAILVGDSRFDREAAAAAGVRFAAYGTEGEIRLDNLNEVLALMGQQ